jgi:hypothetical protein
MDKSLLHWYLPVVHISGTLNKVTFLCRGFFDIHGFRYASQRRVPSPLLHRPH